MMCPYCRSKANLVNGRAVHPHVQSVAMKLFYVCWPCDARVGCHGRTSKPLGNLANAELREARGKAHKSFDPIWKEGFLTRNDAYAWLRDQMQMKKRDCHIAMMSMDECKRVHEISAAYLQLNIEAGATT